MQLQPSTARKVFAALFRKPVERRNGIRHVCFDTNTKKRALAREKARAYWRGWYKRNRPRLLAKVKAWEKAHPERTKERKRAYAMRNVERTRRIKREYMRRQRLLHPENIARWKEAPALQAE